MKMRHRAASCIMALCMIFTLLGTGVPAARAAGETAQTGKIVEVYGIITEDQFNRIFNGTGPYNGHTTQDGDTIKLVGELSVDFKENGDYPLVIRKKLTIDGVNGNKLYMRAGGILLGADVTFKNMVFGFGNMYSNAIMANGWTLTLEDTTVSTSSGRGFAYAFCGGRVAGMDVDQKKGNTYKTPSGPRGQIIFKGNSHLGQPMENRTQGATYGAVFAGSYYDNWDGYNYYGGANPTTSDIPATIIFADGYNPPQNLRIPHVYACGAWMERMNPALGVYSVRNPARFDPINCPVTKPVSVQLYGATVPDIDGMADGRSGSQKYASVTYYSEKGNTYNDVTIFRNISSLSVEDGTLVPKAGSSLASTDVTVKNGAKLGFNNLGIAPAVNDFTGGGQITLGKYQTLTINGAVSGSTEVGLEQINANNASTAIVPAGDETVRIKTPNVTTGTDQFVFLPYVTQKLKFDFDSTKHEWKIIKDTTAKVLVETLELEDVRAHCNIENYDVTIPSSITLIGTDFYSEFLADVTPICELKIDSIDPEYHTCNEDGYVDIGSKTYYVGFTYGERGGICLILYDDKELLSPSTTYNVRITIPAESSATGKEIVREATVTIEAENATIPIKVPTDERHHPYTGAPILGVPINSGYEVEPTGKPAEGTIEAVEAINPGTYTATLTIKDGYQWSDSDTNPAAKRTITWYIDKMAGDTIPEGTLQPVAPEPFSVDGGWTISGLTDEMEYAETENAPKENWTTYDSTDDNTKLTNVAPGKTYWVRYKETSFALQGEAVSVTVPTLTGIAVTKAPAKTVYNVGDPSLDLTGMELKCIFSDGSEYPLETDKVTVTGFNTSAEGDVKLTVTYNDIKTEQPIIVLPQGSTGITGITIKTPATKTEYMVGEQLDFTGLTIEVTGGSADPIPVTANMVSTNFDATKPGLYTVVIRYLNATTSYEVVTKAAYTVTVNGGTPVGLAEGGKYVADASVTLTAPTRDGYTFTGWTAPSGVTLSPNANALTVTFTMPANDVTLTMNWTKDGGTKPTEYTVTVDGGTASPQSCVAGTTVTVTATPQTGKTFDGWTVTGATLPGSPDLTVTPLTFTMPKSDVTLTANWTDNGGTTPEPTKYTVTVTGGETVTAPAANYAAGDSVTLTAKANGNYKFVRWESADLALNNATNQEITFTMPTKNVTLTMVWQMPDIDASTLTTAAPVPYSGVDTGKILGTTTAMEYTVKGANDWKSCGDKETAAASGTYEVRRKANGAVLAGAAREVTVDTVPTLEALSIKTHPTKEVYQWKSEEKLDLTGLVLDRVMTDDKIYPLTVTNDMVGAGKEITVSGFSTSAVNPSLPITLEYEGKTVSFNVAVRDPSKPYTTAIAVSSSNHKTQYRVGDTIDLTNLTITATLSDNSKQENIAVTSNMISGFETDKAGECTVTITYDGVDTTFKITVEGRRHVTVKGEGNVDGLNADGYFKGDTVTLTAQARSGYTFDKWEAAGLTLAAADAVKQTLSFTMPDNDVTLTMTWKQNTQTPPSSGGGGGGGGAVIVPPANNAVSTGSESGADGTAQTVTTVRPSVSANGTSATVDTAMAQEMVKQVKDTSGDAVRLAPEMKDDVTKAEVSVPASALQTLGKETKASVTVALPVAEISIGNADLEQLGKSGGTVTIGAERDGSALTLTVTAGGAPVTEVGVTVTVPYKDATDSTVAVLVGADGTRTVVRKTAVQDGTLRLPLTGNAKIEMVDNRKEFHDMGNAGWAQSAVTFVSSREILSGTGNGRFEPGMTMTRSMLVQALYNLEGSPAVSAQGRFDDVERGAWYNDAVHWAADKGIVTGYGNGAFGVADPITREQLAVILWRYSGSPTVDTHTGLTFHDAHLISSYGQDAMHWAVARGVLSGKGNGTLDPRGQASRAEVAQMLKNFMQIRL